jgi:hypothetical protein
VTPEIRKLLAYFYIGSATSEDFIEWAVRMLELDFDSKNLRILAALTKPLYTSEVEEYLKRSFTDLGWHFPNREEALRLYGCDIAESVSSEIMFPEEGCCEMYKICGALGNPLDLEAWRSLDLELHTIEEHEGNYGGEIDGLIIQEARKYKVASCI